VAAIEAFVVEHRLPLITFEKGQRKDEVMAAHLARFTGGLRPLLPEVLRLLSVHRQALSERARVPQAAARPARGVRQRHSDLLQERPEVGNPGIRHRLDPAADDLEPPDPRGFTLSST